MKDLDFWSERYIQQAKWTKQTRNHIINQISLNQSAKVLEIGCGSQAVLREFTYAGYQTFGVDIDFQMLAYSHHFVPESKLINANGHFLPFNDDLFDFCFCHYLLLWLKEPKSILEEMARVIRKGGWICCFAEPDYLSRIDFPPPLDQLGTIQNNSLVNQGVNLAAGRNLINWLKSVNLCNIYWGILGAHQQAFDSSEDETLEWDTVQKDLRFTCTFDNINQFKNTEMNARHQGTRILHIPTFYAYAQK